MAPFVVLALMTVSCLAYLGFIASEFSKENEE